MSLFTSMDFFFVARVAIYSLASTTGLMFRTTESTHEAKLASKIHQNPLYTQFWGYKLLFFSRMAALK